MPERRPRADAARNEKAVLDAADELFARCASPAEVTMAAVATAAGVGKGTLFRRFGDRSGLLVALMAARLEPLSRQVEEGDPPLGPGTPPRERAAALLDAVLGFKLANRHLSLALEEFGSGSPYRAPHYEQWHRTLSDILERIPGWSAAESAFAADALLATVRADLVEHLVTERGLTPEQVRERVAGFVARVLAG
ncbi:TetR/AcrR family transcriptional regulator [Streptomyces cacaoi]|uniref:TetR family transcriptional regulator n=1 Tax=Streptomyces cacaoi TaxID=1898 RepID=A0A4Y3R3E6_STRCI|nr:TetR family transcriptional regulator [Streptomyces cacaoi]NNG89754.1 TetR family transcriptional regulator [Streptomyces cacaoi]GEB52034.1 TetR family transcriptional regulator [Streptomyces cacaoi]